MKIGITTDQNRTAACFPGAALWILNEEQQQKPHEVIETNNWQPLAWPQELMRRDVNLLLCAGIGQFLWGSMQGYGIQVVVVEAGILPGNALEQWRSGALGMPQTGEVNLCCKDSNRRMGRRFRGGRGGRRNVKP